MSKTDDLFKTIELLIKAEQDDLRDELDDFPLADKVVSLVDEYETKIARLLTKQKNYFKKIVKGFVVKENFFDWLVLINFIENEGFNKDEFEAKMKTTTEDFLNKAVKEFATDMMEEIDPDIPFVQPSMITVNWINDWSPKLAELMKLKTHTAIRNALNTSLDLGESIAEAADRLAQLPEFNRRRARMTALTEMLTASSVAQQESFRQSPAVTTKRWKHSGSKNNKPRPVHVALSGTTVPVEQTFDVNGYPAQYPRDVGLPAGERINCHCYMEAGIDEEILGLTADEKDQIRQQVLAEIERDSRW